MVGSKFPAIASVNSPWGRFEDAYVQRTPVYVVFDAAGQAVAFLNLIPSYDPALATVDLMRRKEDSVNGVMDFLFAKTFLDLKDREVDSFSLGMAPLTASHGEKLMNRDERAVAWLMQRLPFLFRADSLRRFKAKYADDWQPRYVVYQSRLDLLRLAVALRRVTELPGPRRQYGVRAPESAT
ncbi:MAG: phosphatidylglycerol lysyltransferase domain-containing protein [Acidobacteriota bacterium]